MTTYYKFRRFDRTLQYGDGRVVEPGQTYTNRSGQAVLCQHGFHAAEFTRLSQEGGR